MYYSLEKEKRTKPCVVTIKEQKLGILTDDKDAGFLAMAQQAFDKQSILSEVRLTVDGCRNL